MRRVSHNNTDMKLYDTFNEFTGKIRRFGMLKVRTHRVWIEYKDQDLNYIYATLEIDGKYVCHIRIDHRYRNKRFKIDVIRRAEQFESAALNKTRAKLFKSYINLAMKAIEKKTGWRRIGPDE